MNKATKPLTHIEHPEDEVLTGNLDVLFALNAAGTSSLKIDGIPAVVWGTNPDTGKFGVSTKSFFNKKKVKVCYTHEDVDTYFGNIPNLAKVLHACLQYLPRTEGLYQGDFIGFGGKSIYTPNALTYDFGEVVEQDIIMAPHTKYIASSPVWTSVPTSNPEFYADTDNVKWVQPIVDRRRSKRITFNTDGIEFLSPKEAAQAKVAINALIKSGQSVDIHTLTDIIGDSNLAALYEQVMIAKQYVMSQFIIANAPKCYLNGERIQGEGFVLTTAFGVIKLVDRAQFSFANFNTGYQK
ncbi:hypothetical protein SCREM2_gp87 [Synechococcus phage S-CREM2]|nr:hypothetical protein SCREM2_gp87 [Synechococcus phage S-CREM2]